MAASPRWKVYDSAGIYQASCKEIEAAAAVVSMYGDGSTIRHHHRAVVWLEGLSADGEAGQSYDDVAETVLARVAGGSF